MPGNRYIWVFVRLLFVGGFTQSLFIGIFGNRSLEFIHRNKKSGQMSPDFFSVGESAKTQINLLFLREAFYLFFDQFFIIEVIDLHCCLDIL
mgnify:FL=1